MILEEQVVGEFGQLALEEVLGVGDGADEVGGESLVLNEDRSEVFLHYQLVKLAPESSVLGKLGISEGPNDLSDTLGMKVVNLLAKNR